MAVVLRPGDSNDLVRLLQARLNRDYPLYSNLVVDGIYGPRTTAVVREFQRRAGLVVDGIAGPRNPGAARTELRPAPAVAHKSAVLLLRFRYLGDAVPETAVLRRPARRTDGPDPLPACRIPRRGIPVSQPVPELQRIRCRRRRRTDAADPDERRAVLSLRVQPGRRGHSAHAAADAARSTAGAPRRRPAQGDHVRQSPSPARPDTARQQPTGIRHIPHLH